MKEVTKEKFEMIYGSQSKEYKDKFMSGLVIKSNKMFIKLLNYEEFQNIMLFPFKRQPTFLYMHQLGLLNKDNKLSSTKLVDATKIYKGNFVIDEEIRKITEEIKTNKDFIYRNKYMLIYESSKPETLYLIDGYHRMMAYETLILRKEIKYKTVSCILLELDNIKQIGILHTLDMFR